MTEAATRVSAEKRILIVDDHPDLRLLVRESLEASGGGYRFCEVANADDVLGFLEAFRPRVVLLDVMLPGSMDGYRLCERIKGEPRFGAPYVIMLTARGQEADRVRGRSAGADLYLVKPFSPIELMERVAQAFSDNC